MMADDAAAIKRDKDGNRKIGEQYFKRKQHTGYRAVEHRSDACRRTAGKQYDPVVLTHFEPARHVRTYGRTRNGNGGLQSGRAAQTYGDAACKHMRPGFAALYFARIPRNIVNNTAQPFIETLSEKIFDDQ